jgi:hypothetical protein
MQTQQQQHCAACVVLQLLLLTAALEPAESKPATTHWFYISV